ncbi:MAG: alpha-glucosidase [Magnetococcales bacterium]|nr:alpha-glucosidase [Magnetococcales bacterium]
MTAGSQEWWRGAVIYQIYPRSFNDSNADGIGDLQGIISKLEYIAKLGADGIWVSPFLMSPQEDYGYDISDYKTVDPMFGTNNDWKAVIDKAHELGLKVLMDMVFSHTSNQHPWFLESRSDTKNPKADWYLWADPKADGSPPNNWICRFNNCSAWTWEPRRKQYYFHNFLASQPDLNFHNPEVREAAKDVMRFWLDLGVDGFRFDVVNFYFQDKELRDNPPFTEGDPKLDDIFESSPLYLQRQKYNRTRPENIEFIKEIRALLDEYPDTTSIGEVSDDDNIRLAASYTKGMNHLHQAYTPFLLRPDNNNAALVRKGLQIIETEFDDSWPMWATGNHDVQRIITRWSEEGEAYNADKVKTLMVLSASMRGSVLLYQGDELGLPEVLDMPLEMLRDPLGIALYPEAPGRDGCRVPLPWAKDQENAGFSIGQPWLPVPHSFHEFAADVQEADENSVLNFTRKFLNWRRTQPAMVAGKLHLLEDFHEDLVCYERELDDQKLTFVFNLSGNPLKVKQSDFEGTLRFLADLTSEGVEVTDSTIKMPAWSFFIAEEAK